MASDKEPKKEMTEKKSGTIGVRLNYKVLVA